MSDERTCQNCGASLKPAMLKCMECGTRMSIQSPDRAATTDNNVVAVQQNVRIVGASTATLTRPRVVGRRGQPTHSPGSPSERRLQTTGREQDVSSQATKTSQRPKVKGNLISDTSSGEGLTIHEGSPTDRQQDSQVCQCPCGARFRFPCHMAGQRRRCRKCRQPLILPTVEEKSGISKAMLAADASDVLTESVEKAVSSLKVMGGSNASKLRKTLSSKLLKEYTLALEVEAESSSQSTIDRRRLTILKLGRSRDARAFELIEPFVDNPSKVVRQAVATAVGEAGDQRGLWLGLCLLGDNEAAVVREAIRSLKVLADPVAIRPLMLVGLTDPLLRAQAMHAVAGFGCAALPELLEIIETRNPLTSGDAVTVLGRIGDQQAVPSLLMSLDHADAGLRAKTVEALGRLGDRSVVAKVVDLLADSDETVQLSTVRAVQKIPDRRAVKPLLAILKRTQNADLRRQSVIALGATGSEKIVPTLSALLDGADAELTKAIADALSRIDSVEAAEALTTMLQADDLAVVTKALVGLRKNPVTSSTPMLLQLCEHPNVGVRRHAVEALAETGQDVVFDILQQRLLSDSSTEVRAAAARSSGKTGDRRLVSVLEKALRDEPSVRSAALCSLAGLGDESSIPALLVSLKDEVPEVRYHAVTGLGKLKASKAICVIQALLEDESEMVRLGAKTALQNLGVQNTSISLSRRMLKLASGLIPDRLAGVLPAGSVLAGAAIVLVTCGLGWIFLSGSGGRVDNGIALARATPVLQARWLPGSSDVILLRNGGPADVWDGVNGDFKSKVEVPSLTECGPACGLMSENKDTLVSWIPDGYRAVPRILKTPPSKPFGLSGNAETAVYLGKNRRVWIWDTIQGKNLVDLDLEPVPLPVLNSDGTVVAGQDNAGNIVLIDVAAQTTIGEIGVAGNTKASENGAFKAMMFSAAGNALAVFRTDRVVLCKVANGNLSISEIKERVDPTVAQFPNESVIYSARDSSIVCLELATEESRQWEVSDRELTINSLSISEDESMAAVSAEGKKFGWVVRLDDGSTRKLSPLGWAAE